ncbi:MAG: geranylgeranylglyceryl/heptaprenylglyceryl phosphate synthase [Bacteroidetes bacterium]|nr:geranylgeranylglyceryl/heptaprenylglyceryl phosphate synthase [Bacteroidota bacterium]
MQTNSYKKITEAKEIGKKLFAVLIDPDKFNSEVITTAEAVGVDLLMVGGSILSNGNIDTCICEIKKITKIPVIIFPGNNLQISKHADGILLLSLISGRNAELLIGKHVVAAPMLKASGSQILPTGYMLIESGRQTAATYMSNTSPIPHDKDDIAMCTAMAGEQLGLKLIYMDAGSGALNTISPSMIKKVSESISIPLIIGGGISSSEKAITACNAGADVIVVGNAIESDRSLISSIAKAVHSFKN